MVSTQAIIYMTLPEQFQAGIKAAQKVHIDLPKSSRLIICGMGGSIMPAEALSMLWLDQPAIYINRTAYLPHWADTPNLVICISWSGQTAETIACFEEAVAKNIPVAVITTGGRLAEMTHHKNIPLVLLPAHGLNPVRSLARAPSASPQDLGEDTSNGINPRDALGLMFSALTSIIHSAIMDGSVDFSSSPFSVKEDLAVKLASKIGAKTPLIYSSYPWRFLGSWWKIFFNENAKIHAFFNCLPGAGHNEIAGIKKEDQNFFYLLLKDPDDHPANNQKISQLAKFLDKQKTDYEIVALAGKSRLEKILRQYLLASDTSVKLAHQLGVDPHSTETIESFKRLS